MDGQTGNKHFFPITYGIVHAIIDAVCVTVVFSSIVMHDLEPHMSFRLVVLYDLLAFAGQAFFGYITDRLKFSRGAILAGIALTAASVAFLEIEPITAIVLTGIGNALFHVGAGALSLHVTPGRAAAPGIFVGPGALGLGLGIWMGKRGLVYTWPLLIILAVAFIFAIYSKNPEIPYEKKLKRLDIEWPYLIMGLLLFSIAIRSLVGFAGAHACPRLPWPEYPWVIPVAFASAAFGGKALGGIVSDRLGWIPVSVGALLISAPLIAFFGTNPVVLVIGLFFFQMTMPVTLVAIAAVIPGKPAFAFGLACLVLILGALPTFFAEVKALYNSYAFFAIIVLSAAVVFFGLKLLNKKVPMKF
ncbi:MAG: MFS transporter [Deltaproteobacteria bacterium]|nr:MFS transporter [Deltaproteobacteria bacterium]